MMPSLLEHAVVELTDGRILSGVAELLLDDFAATGTTLLYCSRRGNLGGRS
jgi:hypothetical protein